MPEIVITVKPDGEVKVHAEGIQGSACSLHTKPFVDAVGTRSGEEPLTEMFTEEKAETTQELRQ